MATKRKPTRRTTKRQGAKRRTRVQKSDIDQRWSILLFGLGAFFVLLSLWWGEAAGAFVWLQKNLLFGVFGMAGWLVGPLLIYLAVLVGMQKPLGGALLRSSFVMLTLAGAALVFGSASFEGLGFLQTIRALFITGQQSRVGGGFLSLFLGYTLLAFCGRTVARILLVIVTLVAVMLFTGVTPADVVRFIQTKLAQRPRRAKVVETYEEEPEEEYYEEEEGYSEEEPRRTGWLASIFGGNKRQVDIDLGPQGPVSAPGLAEHDEVEVGPGGTFGMNPLEAPVPSPRRREEPLLPFDPYSTQSLYDGAEENQGTILLFGEEDPLAPAGGGPKAAPKSGGSLFDYDRDGVAPQPAPEPEVNELFAEAAVVDMPRPASGKVMAGEVAGVLSDEDKARIRNATNKNKDNEAAGVHSGPGTSSAGYRMPTAPLFDVPSNADDSGAIEEMERTADLLVNTLASFGVQTKIINVSRGPSVTRYEVQPQSGVKISRITGLADDIALNLAAAGVRIEAPIPGKPAVGIEVPNKVKSPVAIRSILESNTFHKSASPLSIALGKDIAGDCVVADLTKMPHLLIAGSTGSGKSVCVNATIMSFLCKASPDDLKLLLIDPKVVELAEYNGIPHLAMPVVTEPRKAAAALGAAVAEMEKRYHLFAENNVRDIRTYNALAARDGTLDKMPYMAIVIDELADLMMTAGKDVENYICRIAQKARAAGMHLIVATQRPSVDVITGLIKANIPSRIAFAVSSQVDSRTILDGAGAEKLLGMGDMLFMPVGANKPVRVQGTYVKDEEIKKVLDFIKAQSGEETYDEAMIAEMEKRASADEGGAGGAEGDSSLFADETFVSAVEMALEAGQVSTSNLQRRLRLGYARAGRIVDEMEQLGIISGPNGSKPRELLITRDEWLEMSMNAAK